MEVDNDVDELKRKIREKLTSNDWILRCAHEAVLDVLDESGIDGTMYDVDITFHIDVTRNS